MKVPPPVKPFQRAKGMEHSRPLEVRFWEKVEVRGVDECWNWVGCVSGKAPHFYGRIKPTGQRERKAHQVSWELFHKKPFPKGKICRHTCDNPLCVNPKHLLVGTLKQNTQDAVERGRLKVFRGEESSNAVLTTSQIVSIRALYESSAYSQYELATMFKVSQTQISRIIRGKRWAHVS